MLKKIPNNFVAERAIPKYSVIRHDFECNSCGCGSLTVDEESKLFQNNKAKTTESTEFVYAKVTTSGLSFDVTYDNDDPGFDPDAQIYEDKSIKEWIEIYLASWGPNVMTNTEGFETSIIITFEDNGNNSIVAGARASLLYGYPISLLSPVSGTFEIEDVADNNIEFSAVWIVQALNRDLGMGGPSPDILMFINTNYIKRDPAYYNYQDSFTCPIAFRPFKQVLIHEINHGLGFAQNIVPSGAFTYPYFFNFSLFRNSLLPDTLAQYQENARLRIGRSTGSEVMMPVPISLSYLGKCVVPIDQEEPSHLVRSTEFEPRNGIMEPFIHPGGSPWTVNDGTGLACVGWNNTRMCCYSGNSIIMVKHIETKELSQIRVSELLSNVHEVYDTRRKKYVPIKFNIVMGNTKKFVLIKKDSLGVNEPSEDFYVTAGHRIMYHRVSTKAKDIPGAKSVDVTPQKVYTICTDIKRRVNINNLEVITWSYDEWMAKADESNIIWTDNKV